MHQKASPYNILVSRYPIVLSFGYSICVYSCNIYVKFHVDPMHGNGWRMGAYLHTSPLCISTSAQWFVLKIKGNGSVIHVKEKVELSRLQSFWKYFILFYSALSVMPPHMEFEICQTFFILCSSIDCYTSHQIWTPLILCSLHNSFFPIAPTPMWNTASTHAIFPILWYDCHYSNNNHRTKFQNVPLRSNVHLS